MMPLKRPTTTPLPDEIYDEWAPVLGEAELKALLYIVRRTLGFKKAADAISLRQFLSGIVTRDGRRLDKGCGVKSRPNLVRALKSLEDRGVIRSYKAMANDGSNDVTVYALWWDGDERTPQTLDGGGSEKKLPWFRCEQEAVSQQHHGSVGATPTTNSRTTNSRQQNSPLTVRQAPAVPAHQFARSRLAPRALETSTDLHREDPHLTHDASAVDAAIPTERSTQTQVTHAAVAQSQLRLDPDYQALVTPVTDLTRELGDGAPARSSITRAYNLMREAGLPFTDFVPLLYEPRALTRAHQAGITKLRGDAGRFQRKNLVPYFFAVLDSLLHPEAHPPRRQEAHLPQRRRTRRPEHHTAGAEPARAVDDSIGAQDLGSATMASADRGDEIWQAVLAELQLVLTRENYDTWLSATRAVSRDGNLLRVAVPERFHKDWLDLKLRRRIEATLQRVGYGAMQVEFVPEHS